MLRKDLRQMLAGAMKDLRESTKLIRNGSKFRHKVKKKTKENVLREEQM